MSIHFESLVYSRITGSSTRKMILGYLANRCGDGGQSFVSKSKIARELECSRQTVITTMAALADDGILILIGQKKVANGFIDEYVICREKLAALPMADGSDSDLSKSGHLSTSFTSHVKDVDTDIEGKGNLSSLSQQSSFFETVEGKGSAREAEFDAEFDKVWAAYPRKVGKDAARAKWRAARRKASKDEIGASLWAHIKVWKAGTETSFIPHLATWLHQGRWKDDPHAAANRSETSDDQLDRLMTPDPLASLADHYKPRKLQ
jgi:hypothetical protein